MSLNHTIGGSLHTSQVVKKDRKLGKLRAARGNAAAVLSKDMEKLTGAMWAELLPQTGKILKKHSSHNRPKSSRG